MSETSPPLRKRLRRRVGPTGVRYLTFSCYRWIKLLGNPAIRDQVQAAILASRARCGFALVAWVVMPAHVHLIILPRQPEWPVEKILPRIKGPLAQQTIGRWRRLGPRGAAVLARITDGSGQVRLWQPGGGFDRAVRDVHELVREVNYVHRNPVTRGLVAKETDWSWSSAREYASLQEMAKVQHFSRLHEHPQRAGLPIDTIRIDRCDFPEQSLARYGLMGNHV